MDAGAEVGVGVVVWGESAARGMELVTRSEARGRVFASLEVGTGSGTAEAGGCCGALGRASWAAAASSHAARAEGSIGHADGGGSFGGG